MSTRHEDELSADHDGRLRAASARRAAKTRGSSSPRPHGARFIFAFDGRQVTARTSKKRDAWWSPGPLSAGRCRFFLTFSWKGANTPTHAV